MYTLRSGLLSLAFLLCLTLPCLAQGIRIVIETAGSQARELTVGTDLEVVQMLTKFLDSGQDGTFKAKEGEVRDLVVTIKGGEVTVAENNQSGTFPIDEAREIIGRGLNQEVATTCISTQFVVAKALQAYAGDHQGKYPDDLRALVPEYLEGFPQCPAVGSEPYLYRLGADPAWFQMQCTTDHTAGGLAKGLPAYTSEEGPLDEETLKLLKP